MTQTNPADVRLKPHISGLPTSDYAIHQRADGRWALTQDTWEIGRDGERDWVSDELGSFATISEACQFLGQQIGARLAGDAQPRAAA